MALITACSAALSASCWLSARARAFSPSRWRAMESARRRALRRWRSAIRSEEHTSELQSLMRISYAVFCLKKKKSITTYQEQHTHSLQILTYNTYIHHLLYNNYIINTSII